MGEFRDRALLVAGMAINAVASNSMAKATPESGVDLRVLLGGAGAAGLGFVAQDRLKDSPGMQEVGAAAAQLGAGALHAFVARQVMNRSMA